MLNETRSQIALNGVVSVALLAVLLWPAPLGAQGLIERVTIKGGPSIAYAYQVDSDGEAGQEDATILWNALVTHETGRIAGPLSVSMEFGFVERGYGQLSGTSLGDGESSLYLVPRRWRFLTFSPMAVVVHHRGTLRFHAQAGPRVNWLLGADQYDRVLLELTAGIGVQVPTGVVPVLLEARYNHALTNATSASIWKGRTLLYRAVDLFVGFAF